jgi:hypothetical protein
MATPRECFRVGRSSGRLKRDKHHPAPLDRFTEPAALFAYAAPAQAMGHKLKTTLYRALYALRKQTVEPVFGIVKSVLDF